MDRYSFDPAPAAAGEDASNRAKPRDSLFLAARFTAMGMPAEQVRVRNLSAGGMMVEYPAPIDPGTRVEVELRGIGQVGGRVAWATDGRIGIAFDRHIDPLKARKPVGMRSAQGR